METTMATTQQVVFEHSVRDAIRAEINRFDTYVSAIGQQHLSVSVEYEHARSDGMWKLYTYYKGLSLSTHGALLSDTMTRHINSIKQQDTANQLPSLIAGPSNVNTPVSNGEEEQD
jgi:hypothetical protein